MPKVSPEHLEQRRRQILDAALRCVSRAGLRATTLTHVCEEAGLSRGAVYHYFKSKQEIVEALQAAARGGVVPPDAALAGAAPPPGDLTSLDDPLEQASQYIARALASMQGEQARDAGRVGLHLWAEALVNERVLGGQVEALRSSLVEVEEAIREARERGLVGQALDAASAARAVAAMVLGVQLQLAWEPDAVDVQAVARALQAMITGTFRRDQPPP
jgi:AcrR family transcriptional regulator